MIFVILTLMVLGIMKLTELVLELKYLINDSENNVQTNRRAALLETPSTPHNSATYAPPSTPYKEQKEQK